MKSLKFANISTSLLLLFLIWGSLAGCGVPLATPSLTKGASVPQPTETSTMPTEPATQGTEEMTDLEPSEFSLPESGVVHSAKTREQNPNVDETGLKELAVGNSTFALDLYQTLREGSDNLFFSPYSISLALAMTYGGAHGETAQEMAKTLHFTLPDNSIHTGFNALDLELANRNNEGDEMMPGFKLNIANSAWAQYDRPFEQDYLDLLAENYNTGLYLTDYVSDSEGSRLAINEWVSDETEGKIEDLIPVGALNALTRLVLANAIYFNAGWQSTFDEDLTEDAAFTLVDGGQKNVPMMSTSEPESFGYAVGDGYEAVELPYNGGHLSMVIILPEEGNFETFEASLDTKKLDELLNNLEIKHVELQMPKFSFESEFGLVGVLQQLGMQAAFDPQVADFSRIDGTKELSISDVIHKAFVSVDEKGTEAAAATAVVFRLTSMPMTDIQMTIDRPFILLIQDKPTGTTLFLGRVLDPMQ